MRWGVGSIPAKGLRGVFALLGGRWSPIFDVVSLARGPSAQQTRLVRERRGIRIA